MPASASPDSTLPRTSVTFCSSETGLRVIPWALASFLVASPQGTSGAQMTRLAPSSDESSPVIFLGLPLGTMRVRTLVANSVWLPTSFWSAAVFIVELLAVARTSALSPPAREATRSWEPWKSKVTSRPGLSFSTVFSISSKAFWREAAARTVTLPVAFPAPPEVPAEAAPVAAPVELLEADPPQAARQTAESRLTAAMAARREIPIACPFVTAGTAGSGSLRGSDVVGPLVAGALGPHRGPAS